MVNHPRLRRNAITACDITLEGSILNFIRRMAILSVIIDDTKDQLQARKRRGKLNGRLNALRRVGSAMNTNLRRQIFNASIRLHLT